MDPTTAAVRALATQNSWAPSLAFTAGAASSFSPCVAPRMLTIAALSANKPCKYTLGVVAVFTAGVVAAYSTLTLGGTLIWQVVKYSAYFYVAIAAAMALAGAFALTQHAQCERARPTHSRDSMSAVFLMGASSVATFSPCCMSVITVAVLSARNTGPLFACLTAICFAVGHAAPLTLVAAGSRAVGFAVHANVQSAARVVAGSLMLAVAGFYCVIA